MPDQPADRRHDAAAGLAARAADLAARAGRTDLRRHAAAAARRTTRTAAVVVVVGDYGSGKSSVVNAIAGSPVCPTHPLDATTVVTAVRHGHPSAAVRLAEDAPGETRAIGPSDLAAWLTDLGNPGNERGVEIADIAVPSETLAEGIVLVDTPGTGGMHPGLVGALTDLVPSADALLYVSDAAAPLSGPAVQVLADAASGGLDVIVGLTKVDLHPQWRTVAADATRVLREAGVPAAVVPLALPLGSAPDSGVAGLVTELRRRMVGPTRLRRERSALAVAKQVAAELTAAVRDGDADARRAVLAEGRRRWAAILQEGFAEITVDLDGEVRAGLVRLGSTVDGVLGSVDPGKDWPTVRGAVDESTSALVRRLAAHLSQTRNALAGEIATALGAPGMLDDTVIDLGPVGRSVDVDAPDNGTSTGAVSRGLDVVRGSYGGIVLAGVLGQLVALPVAAPIALGAGAVFGVRQLSDQRRRKVDQRRASARRVVRTHLDETGARLAAAARKAVQTAQRELRDAVEVLIADLDAGPAHAEDVSADAGRLLAEIREVEVR